LLLETLRTGRAAFERIGGGRFFDFMARNPELAETFSGWMSNLTRAHVAALTETYDLSRFRRLVDVGAGHGTLVRGVLERHPGLSAVAFDLPAVCEQTRVRTADLGASRRFEVVEGSFLDGVPKGGDVYVLSQVLHNWDDAACVRILEHCRAGIAADGRML